MEPIAQLITFGHGTASAERIAELLDGAGVAALVDVRTAPGSRRNPHAGRAELARLRGDGLLIYDGGPGSADLPGGRAASCRARANHADPERTSAEGAQAGLTQTPRSAELSIASRAAALRTASSRVAPWAVPSATERRKLYASMTLRSS